VPIGRLVTTLVLTSAGVALTGCGAGHRTVVRIPPRAAHTDLAGAYAILHGLGLRVSVPPGVSITSLIDPRARLSPPAGTRVPRGSTVMLIPGVAAIGSPAVPHSQQRYRVPDFTGQPAAAAIRWADAHRVLWALADLPALHAGDATALYDAYSVDAQTPRPGGTIVQGVRVGRGFRPTPLTLTVAVGT
jgi:hypothetical protein